MGLGVHPRSVLKSSVTAFPGLLQNMASRSTCGGFSGHPAPCNSNSCGMLSKRAGPREHTNMKRVPSMLGMDT